MPGSISAFVQRAGRAARAAGHIGLAVLLAEQSVYSTVLNEHGVKPPKTKLKKGERAKKPLEQGQQSTREETKAKRAYAITRGGQRGSSDRQHDSVLVVDCPVIDEEAEDEGLFSLVQSGTCRRLVLTQVYKNQQPGELLCQNSAKGLTSSEAGPSVPCCDICDPSLLDRTRPGSPPEVARNARVKQGESSVEVLEKLHNWRCTVKHRDFSGSLFSIEALLSNSLIELLSKVGPVSSRARLSVILGGQWGWEATYGDELFSAMQEMNIPAFTPLLPKQGASITKRRREGEVEDNDQQTSNQPGKKKKTFTAVPGIPAEMQVSFELAGYTHDATLAHPDLQRSGFAFTAISNLDINVGEAVILHRTVQNGED